MRFSFSFSFELQSGLRGQAIGLGKALRIGKRMGKRIGKRMGLLSGAGSGLRMGFRSSLRACRSRSGLTCCRVCGNLARGLGTGRSFRSFRSFRSLRRLFGHPARRCCRLARRSLLRDTAAGGFLAGTAKHFDSRRRFGLLPRSLALPGGPLERPVAQPTRQQDDA